MMMSIICFNSALNLIFRGIATSLPVYLFLIEIISSQFCCGVSSCNVKAKNLIPPGPPFSKGGTEELRNFMQLLRAYVLHRKDEDYIVRNGEITIVDEFTGRLAFGKKYEEGLHQAIECKEGLQITPENRVVGRITHPNYLRLYEKKVLAKKKL